MVHYIDKDMATNTFLIYLIELLQIEICRSQASKLHSQYAPTDWLIINGDKVKVEDVDTTLLRDHAFSAAKSWTSRFEQVTKIVLPIFVPGPPTNIPGKNYPGHFTILWCDMLNNKYWYGDSLACKDVKKKGEEFAQYFRDEFLWSWYLHRNDKSLRDEDGKIIRSK